MESCAVAVRLRYLASLILIASMLAGAAQAQEIYRWTDKNGKVHFGDRNSAPENSKEVPVRDSRLSTASPEELQRCRGYARQMMDSRGTPAFKENLMRMQRECPAMRCSFDKDNPEKDRCDPYWKEPERK